VLDSISTLCEACHSVLIEIGPLRGAFYFLPKPPNAPSLLAMEEVALCLATSPAPGIAGSFDLSKGASEAAGRASPFAVEPRRITCITGTPPIFDISFVIPDAVAAIKVFSEAVLCSKRASW
jgi:hypothetical protein